MNIIRRYRPEHYMNKTHFLLLLGYCSTSGGFCIYVLQIEVGKKHLLLPSADNVHRWKQMRALRRQVQWCLTSVAAEKQRCGWFVETADLRCDGGFAVVPNRAFGTAYCRARYD
jgi:hypothetical protein